MAKHRSVDQDLLQLRDLAARNPQAQAALVAADAAMDRGAGPREVRATYREALAEAQVDQHAALELDLYAENTGELSGQFQSIITNLKKKIEAGKYDAAKAWKLWMYWYESAAQRYAREINGTPHVWGQLFPVPLRRSLAKRRAVDEHEKILAGEYGPLKARSSSAKRRHR